MVLDPMSLIMFGLIAVLIFFMFRNGKKRQRAMQELQSNLRPGAEVMLQSGIFATIEDIDDEENRVTVRSGTSTLVVHRNAIGQVVTPVDAPAEEEAELAPDDDPSFGERLGDTSAEAPKNDFGAQPDADGDKPKG
ncbi:preprotein translocase subunit YajC [Leucobacter sp. Z1108]|uniref:preprotein translocase subunit YajC n=1 Tax=unclassified Leucobacter TaxID=2621730 RepID=UPI003D979966